MHALITLSSNKVFFIYLFIFIFCRFIPLWQKVFNYEIIVIGIVGGIAATVSAIISIASPNSLSVPCYIHLQGA